MFFRPMVALDINNCGHGWANVIVTVLQILIASYLKHMKSYDYVPYHSPLPALIHFSTLLPE